MEVCSVYTYLQPWTAYLEKLVELDWILNWMAYFKDRKKTLHLMMTHIYILKNNVIWEKSDTNTFLVLAKP